MDRIQLFKLPEEYRSFLLYTRGLHRPEGRPLYDYRLTSEEFDQLEQILRKIVECVAILDESNPGKGFTMGNVATRLKDFSALFVLYAAEWWRRRFDGSKWAWEPIFEAIGMKRDALNQAQRSQCVIQGLEAWGLKAHTTGGLRYLGSVAVQGGLPLKMLAEAQGHIGNVLRTVLRLAPVHTVTPAMLQAWIESLQHLLPKSYRKPAIYALLSQVAWAVLSLKAEAGLDAGEDPIFKLDNTLPGWRDRFPLPVEDEHARGMIEQLVRDVSRKTVDRQRPALVVTRHIETVGETQWMLRSALDLPEILKSKALAASFNIPMDELPRHAALTLETAGISSTTTLRRLAGQDAYRVECIPMEASGEAAASEHVLHLRAPDGRLWTIEAPGGQPLDEEQPWVFSVTDGRLLREGNGAIADAEAWLALPPCWSVPDPLPPSFGSFHALQQPERRIVRIRETLRTRLPSGHECHIRTQQAEGSAEVRFEWSGRRLWLDSRPCRTVFLGKPVLYRIVASDIRNPIDAKVVWKALGGEARPDPLLGPVEARYLENGTLQHRRRMVVLPENASWSTDGNDEGSGTLRLVHWGCVAARSATPGISVTCRTESDALSLDLAVDVGRPVRPWADIELFWPHTTFGVRFRFPFPGEGVFAFAGDGTPIETGGILAIQRLAGVRLHVLPGTTGCNPELMFTIGGFKRMHRLNFQPAAPFLEIRLMDHLEDIHHLMSTNDDPDAQVNVLVLFNGLERFRVRLVRYAAPLYRDEAEGSIRFDNGHTLSAEQASTLPVLALRLECPGEESVRLERKSSEDRSTGIWSFDPQRLEPGAWLIYPGPDAALPFRPTLWNVTGETPDASSPLARAIALGDFQERQAELDRVIQKLASDFTHDDWSEVERLESQIGHLPLPTLDLWRRFTRNPDGMAALALRFGSWRIQFVERFGRELIFAWETVPYAAWRRATTNLERQCTELFDPPAGAVIFRSHLQQRIAEITAMHGALAYVLGIAAAQHLTEMQNQIAALQVVGASAADRLFAGESSLLMQLRRLHADDEWPNDGLSVVAAARNRPDISRYLCPQRIGYADAVINLPIVLAVLLATGESGNRLFQQPENVHALRIARSFDADWFDSACNETVARCLSDGVLKP
ncbi:MAG: STY4851/ECs_5259 family protein [Thermodesulfobacteriota bacterium]